MRTPTQANARAGFFIAATCWVALTALVAFLHHLFSGQTGTIIGGASSQLKAAFWSWMPHSALGYLLLITIGIDVFIDIQDSKINHSDAWRTLGVVVLVSIALVVLDAISDSLSSWLGMAGSTVSVCLALLSLIACWVLKYFSLRDYQW